MNELSIVEASQALKVSITWVRNLIAKGRLRSRRTTLGIFVNGEDVAKLAVERAAQGKSRRGRLLLQVSSAKESSSQEGTLSSCFDDRRTDDPFTVPTAS